MAGLVNPGGRAALPRKAPAAHLGTLKDTVRGALSLGADGAVLVQQLACTEPGCPPVETVVAVLTAPRRSWKFHGPAANLTAARLREALIEHPEGHDHDDHD